tara:strand:+ start:6248 stop:7006 length:759 start_codon:yes stop_codon:yes gene_type:complete
MEKTKKEKPQVKKDTWEIKNRTYVLRNMSPLGYHLRSTQLYYFDEDKGYEREICYSRNQKTVFIDEMKGDIRYGHVWFRDGALYVPKSNVTLQKFLSLYHPQRDKKYFEVDTVKEAQDQVEDIMLEIEALNVAQNLDVEQMEAIMRVEKGSAVNKMSTKELKRDLLILAKTRPEMFMSLAQDDNVQLRNVGIKAVEAKVINLSQDQRTFTWGSNDRKLMNVPFDENPYSALAAWFKTDEGVEIFSQIEKRLK